MKLLEYLIANSSDAGAVVLDPFLGSGSTAVAAKLLGRHYVGFDIDAHYCDIARERLSAVACVEAS